ncbi:glycoside hydrolase N-terminal domain-containing protein [Microbacterium sp. CH12i]|uniref:glycoside hydrolase N-terminal domain-containing protein n=1 Tax=Microbacterium sp. CH12i TaxID=1479651 RepID=UPI00056972A5|nr:glycoside hydrolase N-terminal domain-containing protein [Microbacterium sp. CH12i]
MSRIRFTGAARTWLECLPLGDGRLGAMTDGGVSSTTIHLNDATAWSGSPSSESTGSMPDAAASADLLSAARSAVAAGDPTAAEAPLQAMQTRYAQSFVPMGDVKIIVEAGDATALPARELDLRTGIHRSGADAIRTTTFIESEQSVLVHVIEPALPVRLVLSSPLRGPRSDAPVVASPDAATTALLLRLPSDVAPGHEPDLPGALWSQAPGSAVEGAIATRVITDATRTVVLVTTATTFAGVGRMPTGSAADALDDAVTRLDAAATPALTS